LIPFLEIGAFPPIRKKKANGWGTELVQIQEVRELECYARGMLLAGGTLEL
jgi:hypothetical protein